jgi:GxxExxY protein
MKNHLRFLSARILGGSGQVVFEVNNLKRDENALSKVIIGAGIEVHRQLGPGLLESAYEECLAYELNHRGISFERQKPIPVVYHNVQLNCGFRVDLLVDNLVVVELKAIDDLAPIHQAQMLTYLKLTKCKLGLLLNFNVLRLRDGIKRIVLNL